MSASASKGWGCRGRGRGAKRPAPCMAKQSIGKMGKDDRRMVLFPKLGAVYWMATDFWERFYSVPVTLESKTGPGLFKADFNGLEYDVLVSQKF